MARVAPRNGRTGMARRIAVERCWGAVINVQDFFLAQLGRRPLRTRTETNLLAAMSRMETEGAVPSLTRCCFTNCGAVVEGGATPPR